MPVFVIPSPELNSMIYEHRTYQITAGKVPEFLKIYEANGLAIITRYAN